jgi:F-type H+-transporting ATPase subunit b
LNGDVHATTEAHGGPEEHAPDPAALGMNATAWVSLAMLILLAVLVWKKVPTMIGGILDKRIAEIRNQLAEATTLRKEAEALKAEYEAKLASAAKDAEALRARAQEEAAQAIEDAKTHAAELVVRRQKMAEDKIASAERAAIADIRARTVKAATVAAATLIQQGHDANADAAMIDQAIKGLGKAH